jgi:hypothetical protein
VADQKRSEQSPGKRSKDSKRSPQQDQDMQRQGSSAAQPSMQGGGSASVPGQQSGRQPRDDAHKNRSQSDRESLDEDEDER